MELCRLYRLVLILMADQKQIDQVNGPSGETNKIPLQVKRGQTNHNGNTNVKGIDFLLDRRKLFTEMLSKNE